VRTETTVDNNMVVLVVTLVALWTLTVMMGVIFYVGATA
jgi:hypothetical protein